MSKPKAVIIVVALALLLVVGIGLWVGYRSGELSFLAGDRIENHEFPKALTDEEQSGTENEPNQPITTSMTSVNANKKTSEGNPLVTLKTTQGDIVLELYEDVMPVTAGNFLSLAENNFYDGTKFHRVIAGFMIQGGDPNSKTDKTETYGTGGPGYAIKDEFVTNEKLSNERGTIAMANSGPNTGGSQFFINLARNTGLDFDKPPESSSHPVFGRVIAGIDVVDRIAKVPTNERDLPLEPVMITDVVVGESIP